MDLTTRLGYQYRAGHLSATLPPVLDKGNDPEAMEANGSTGSNSHYIGIGCRGGKTRIPHPEM
jgi:hypothetical protein